jgi:ankyrin repeat protein
MKPLPFRAPLRDYEQQARELTEGHRTGDAAAIRIIHENHPRFLDETIKWRPKFLTPEDIQKASFDLDDARFALARWYTFADWTAVKEYANAVTVDGPVFWFESAVEAVVNGDLDTLLEWLRDHPELIRARSTRRTPHDPPVHRATLLHYVAANGVEGHRQKTPKNAVAIARALLEAGAEVDATAGMYGGEYTTMSMLVSSAHPAMAGLQAPLAELLLDFGAAIEGLGSEQWRSPLMTALAFGYQDTADALVRRDACIPTVAAAAGLGRLGDAIRLLPEATALDRHRALALAAQLGHVEIVRLLLDAGEDPNRYNPEGNHGHSTPLHQAAFAGHESVVRLLIERGAKLDIRDTVWQGTPLGWALHSGKPKQLAIAAYLREHGASDD